MLIAFGHKLQVGKTDAANYLTGKYDDFAKLSFAKRLKSTVISVFPDTTTYIMDHDYDTVISKGGNNPLNKTARQVLQDTGVALRKIWPRVWIDAVEKKWEYIKRCGVDRGKQYHFVIDDLRFKNEAEWVKKQGGLCVKIERPRGASHGVDKHASETELENYGQWDFTLMNDGPLDDLFLQIDQQLVPEELQ